MNQEERDTQISRISRHDEIEGRLSLLKLVRRRVDPNSVYDLEICKTLLLYCQVGDEAIRQIRTDIVDSIDRQIAILEEEQSKI